MKGDHCILSNDTGSIHPEWPQRPCGDLEMDPNVDVCPSMSATAVCILLGAIKNKEVVSKNTSSFCVLTAFLEVNSLC